MPSDGEFVMTASLSPKRRIAIVEEPPPSNASPSVAPSDRIKAANSGRFKPTLTSGWRPSTSIKKSATIRGDCRTRARDALCKLPSVRPVTIVVPFTVMQDQRAAADRRCNRVELDGLERTGGFDDRAGVKGIDGAVLVRSDCEVIARRLRGEIVGHTGYAVARERRCSGEGLEVHERYVVLRTHVAVPGR